MVVAVRLTLWRFFLAASIPFRIAWGTSLALPEPYPTTPSAGSPMTTSAAKDIFLPPLTTLVTRLIETTSSFRLRRFASIFFFIAIMSYPAFWRPIWAPWETLEIETRFTGCIGEGFDAAVIQIAATIKHNLLDALLLRALGDQLADFGRRGD